MRETRHGSAIVSRTNGSQGWALDQWSLRGALNIVERPVRRMLFQHQTLSGHADDRQVREDHAHHRAASQWIAAAPHDLGRAITHRVLHGDPQLARAGGKIGSPADTAGPASSPQPISDVTILRYLECSEYGHVQVSAANDREGS